MRARGEIGGAREEGGEGHRTIIQLTGTSFQYHLEGDYPDRGGGEREGGEGKEGRG